MPFTHQDLLKFNLVPRVSHLTAPWRELWEKGCSKLGTVGWYCVRKGGIFFCVFFFLLECRLSLFEGSSNFTSKRTFSTRGFPPEYLDNLSRVGVIWIIYCCFELTPQKQVLMKILDNSYHAYKWEVIQILREIKSSQKWNPKRESRHSKKRKKGQ